MQSGLRSAARAKGYSILNFDIDTVVNTLYLEMAAQVAAFNKDKCILYSVNVTIEELQCTVIK